MKLSFINTYLTVTVLLISVIACNPKEEIVPENPCGNYKQPYADFIMEQTTGERNANNTDYIWYNNPDYNKDSIVEPTLINFRSEFTDTTKYKHTWYIGSQKFTAYKVWRDFYNAVAPNTYITIHHVLKWTPNTLCNPNDIGYDSISYTFKIGEKYKDLYAFGKYKMVYDTVGAPLNQDSIEVEFYATLNGNKDSTIINPLFANGNIDIRVKGLYNMIPKGGFNQGLKNSNLFPIDDNGIVFANLYIIAKGDPNTTGTVNTLKLFVDKNKTAHLTYNSFYYDSPPIKTKSCSMIGRKIN